MKYRDVTAQIIGAAYDISNELGHGFLESVYEKALLIALHERGVKAESQVALHVLFHGQSVGNFFADLLVEDCVIVELKAVDCLLSEHQAQLIHYLKATHIPVGLLINLGTPHVTIKRAFWNEIGGKDVEDISNNYPIHP